MQSSNAALQSGAVRSRIRLAGECVRQGRRAAAPGLPVQPRPAGFLVHHYRSLGLLLVLNSSVVVSAAMVRILRATSAASTSSMSGRIMWAVARSIQYFAQIGTSDCPGYAAESGNRVTSRCAPPGRVGTSPRNGIMAPVSLGRLQPIGFQVLPAAGECFAALRGGLFQFTESHGFRRSGRQSEHEFRRVREADDHIRT